MDPRIQKAKQAGYSDQEIQAYLAKKQTIPQSDPIPGVIKAAAPVIGGGLGAAAGSVGGPVGSLATGALGAQGGQALINLLERLSGGPAPQTTSQNSDSLRNAGAMQIAGEGAGRALGFIANPIRGLAGNVAGKIAESTKGINLDELLKLFRGEVGQEGIAPLTKVGADIGMGKEASAALDAMIPRIKEVVSTRTPFLNNMSDVPIQTAQHLKQVIPDWGNVLKTISNGGADEMYAGGVKSPGLTVPKEFNSLLRQKIEEAVPGVKIPNALMHLLYQVPDTLSGLSTILGTQAGRTVRNVGGMVGSLPGKVIPENGGILKYLLQLGLQGGQQNSQSN